MTEEVIIIIDSNQVEDTPAPTPYVLDREWEKPPPGRDAHPGGRIRAGRGRG